MNFADSISKMYSTKWSFINSFSVDIQIPPALLKAANWNNYNSNDLQLHILSINSPGQACQPIESVVANNWVVTNGRGEISRFSITFRDYNQVDLYKKFLKMFKATFEQYIDDAKLRITIYKDADWIGEAEHKAVMEMPMSLIESVSEMQFSTSTENQVAEFTVFFKSAIAIPK